MKQNIDIEEAKKAADALDDEILDVLILDNDEDDCQGAAAVVAHTGAMKEDFLDIMLRSEANVKKGNELLLRAVRTFEE